MAVALDDDLNEWQKLDAITPDTKEGNEHHDKYRSWDPYGWVDGDTYYAIFGGQNPGVAKSPMLEGDWQYTGDLFAHGVDGVSLEEDVSCADLFKLGNKDLLLCISHKIGCRYYIGEWRDEQFYPESHGQMSWVDNSYFAPESLVDDKGRRIMWAWLMDIAHWRKGWDRGWTGTMSLPRVLTLDDNDQLLIDVPEEIKALRYRPFRQENVEVSPIQDVTMADMVGNSFELAIVMDSVSASEFGVRVCVSPDGKEETVISYDAAEKVLKINGSTSGPEATPNNVEAGPFELLQGEQLKLRVFVDKSVIEVFANSRQGVMRMVYPSRDSVGVLLFSKGGSAKVHTFESWHISPSNPF